MSTDKPRFTVTVSEEIKKSIEDFYHTQKFKNQSQAVNQLIARGLDSLLDEKTNVHDPCASRTVLDLSSSKLTLGETIIFYRAKSGLTQRQLADILGITPTRLNYWEKDKRQPDVGMIKALASALHVSVDVLIGNPIPFKSSFELSAAEISIIKKYRALDEHGKEMVDLVLEKELERVSIINPIE